MQTHRVHHRLHRPCRSDKHQKLAPMRPSTSNPASPRPPSRHCDSDKTNRFSSGISMRLSIITGSVPSPAESSETVDDNSDCDHTTQTAVRDITVFAHLASGTVATSDYTSHWIRVWWIGRVERSTHVSKRRFLEIFCATRDASRI